MELILIQGLLHGWSGKECYYCYSEDFFLEADAEQKKTHFSEAITCPEYIENQITPLKSFSINTKITVCMC